LESGVLRFENLARYSRLGANDKEVDFHRKKRADRLWKSGKGEIVSLERRSLRMRLS
jgi:hypothetical protein